MTEYKASGLNGEVVKSVVKELGLQQNADLVPSMVSNVIQPVCEVGKRVTTICKYANATGTLYTTSSMKDTYLTGANLTAMQLAGGGTANNQIYFMPEGGTSAGYLTITLDGTGPTGGNDTLTMSFPQPVKLARGSNVGLTIGTTAGAGSVFLYEVETQ